MTFVQIIEFTTSRRDDMEALFSQWIADGEMHGLVQRVLSTSDRDSPNTYVTIVEFESYEAAMQNSERPATGEFSARMMALSDGEPIFRNLDVTTQWSAQ
ncbi:MAG: hypothetical protein Q7L55_09855 [Actinomycetota bacterium]|nr:hypothetical protein [Actinomycetota bacterium]